MAPLKIGIIGAGMIGVPLARHLVRIGHTVRIANTKGPDSADLQKIAADTGATASTAADAAAGADVQLSSGQLTSGTAQFECLWENRSNEPMSVCFWWSQHSLLMGVGIRMDAQTTADALAEAKGYASLR